MRAAFITPAIRRFLGGAIVVSMNGWRCQGNYCLLFNEIGRFARIEMTYPHCETVRFQGFQKPHRNGPWSNLKVENKVMTPVCTSYPMPQDSRRTGERSTTIAQLFYTMLDVLYNIVL